MARVAGERKLKRKKPLWEGERRRAAGKKPVPRGKQGPRKKTLILKEAQAWVLRGQEPENAVSCVGQRLARAQQGRGRSSTKHF